MEHPRKYEVCLRLKCPLNLADSMVQTKLRFIVISVRPICKHPTLKWDAKCQLASTKYVVGLNFQNRNKEEEIIKFFCE